MAVESQMSQNMTTMAWKGRQQSGRNSSGESRRNRLDVTLGPVLGLPSWSVDCFAEDFFFSCSCSGFSPELVLFVFSWASAAAAGAGATIATGAGAAATAVSAACARMMNGPRLWAHIAQWTRRRSPSCRHCGSWPTPA